MIKTEKVAPGQSSRKVLWGFVGRRGKRHKSRVNDCQKAGMDLSHEIATAAGWKRKASIVVSDGRVSNGTN